MKTTKALPLMTPSSSIRVRSMGEPRVLPGVVTVPDQVPVAEAKPAERPRQSALGSAEEREYTRNWNRRRDEMGVQ